jgi:hypothetical protein
MMNLNQLPPDLQASRGSVDRQSMLAKALLQQAMTPQQGQMVSGHYVSPGIAGAIAPLVQAFMSKQAQTSADQGSAEIANQYNQRLASGLESYSKTYNGAKGTQQSTLTPDQAGPEMVDGFVKASPHQANIQAIGSGIQPLYDLGMEDLRARAKAKTEAAAKTGTPEKFGHTPVEVIGKDGKPTMVLIGDYGTQLPMSDFAPKREFMTVGDRVVDKRNPIDIAADYRPQFSKPYGIGPDLYQKEEGTGKIDQLNKAPRTNVSVGGAQIINKGETKFSETLGTGRAKTFLEAETRALAANRTLGSVAQLRDLEAKGISSGKFAAAGGALAEVASAFGVPVDTNKLANTQGYDQQVAKQVADVLTAGGGIGRSMNEGDRVAFEKSLPSRLLTAQGRAQVYAQMERDAKADLGHYQSLQQTLSQNPVYAESQGMLTVDPVGAPGQKIQPPGNVPPVGGRPSGGAKPKTIIKGW